MFAWLPILNWIANFFRLNNANTKVWCVHVLFTKKKVILGSISFSLRIFWPTIFANGSIFLSIVLLFFHSVKLAAATVSETAKVNRVQQLPLAVVRKEWERMAPIKSVLWSSLFEAFSFTWITQLNTVALEFLRFALYFYLININETVVCECVLEEEEEKEVRYY